MDPGQFPKSFLTEAMWGCSTRSEITLLAAKKKKTIGEMLNHNS